MPHPRNAGCDGSEMKKGVAGLATPIRVGYTLWDVVGGTIAGAGPCGGGGNPPVMLGSTLYNGLIGKVVQAEVR